MTEKWGNYSAWESFFAAKERFLRGPSKKALGIKTELYAINNAPQSGKENEHSFFFNLGRIADRTSPSLYPG